MTKPKVRAAERRQYIARGVKPGKAGHPAAPPAFRVSPADSPLPFPPPRAALRPSAFAHRFIYVFPPPTAPQSPPFRLIHQLSSKFLLPCPPQERSGRWRGEEIAANQPLCQRPEPSPQRSKGRDARGSSKEACFAASPR